MDTITTEPVTALPATNYEFRSWGKIPRLSKECTIITEKIDGTNAQIFMPEDGQLLIGSRSRWITPDQDNFGFARCARLGRTGGRGGLAPRDRFTI